MPILCNLEIDIYKFYKIEQYIQDFYIDVFNREVPLCDVPQGLIGDPPFFQKGIPLSENVIVQR